VKLERHVAFEVPSTLPPDRAVAFVRDVERSLRHADFLERLDVDEDGVVTALLPVNAALFGAQRLRFRSRIDPTEAGAVLVGLDLDDTPGWARVGGEGHVRPDADGSLLRYVFDIEIHLKLPHSGRWGGRALLRMIDVTADNVLAKIQAAFPEAVRAAAQDAARETDVA